MNNSTPGSSQDSPNSPDTTAKKKATAPMTLNEKKIAVNVYKYIEQTMEKYPYKSEIIKTTAEIMGVTERTIQRIISSYNNTGSVPPPKKRLGSTKAPKKKS